MDSDATKFKKPIQSLSTFKYPFPADGSINEERIVQTIKDNWFLNRSPVGSGIDQCAENLRAVLNDSEILSVPSGADCFTWQVPNTWNVRSGRLLTTKGKVVVDFANNPLHLWTHAIPFKGRISREELLSDHVTTDPTRPNEFVYNYHNGYRFDVREWGFSIPYNIVEKMTDDFYDVEIDSDLDQSGTLKVVDAFLPGEYDETILIMAHTCHPAIVSDGIGCIAIAVELFYHLSALPNRKFSYRFLFGPEYFGGVAWLAHAEKKRVKNAHLGIFLDMLTTHEPLVFQDSMQGDSRIDKIARNVMRSHVECLQEYGYRKLWGNDELFYNGPDHLIPTVGISRAMHREYHYDTDNFKNLDLYHSVESTWILMRIAEIFETDFVPVRKFTGPLYLSRYGLYIDATADVRGYELMEHLMVAMDGKTSCMDIADRLDADFFYIRDFCKQLAEKDLIDMQPRRPKKTDCGSL